MDVEDDDREQNKLTAFDDCERITVAHENNNEVNDSEDNSYHSRCEIHRQRNRRQTLSPKSAVDTITMSLEEDATPLTDDQPNDSPGNSVELTLKTDCEEAIEIVTKLEANEKMRPEMNEKSDDHLIKLFRKELDDMMNGELSSRYKMGSKGEPRCHSRKDKRSKRRSTIDLTEINLDDLLCGRNERKNSSRLKQLFDHDRDLNTKLPSNSVTSAFKDSNQSKKFAHSEWDDFDETCSQPKPIVPIDVDLISNEEQSSPNTLSNATHANEESPTAKRYIPPQAFMDIIENDETDPFDEIISPASASANELFQPDVACYTLESIPMDNFSPISNCSTSPSNIFVDESPNSLFGESLAESPSVLEHGELSIRCSSHEQSKPRSDINLVEEISADGDKHTLTVQGVNDTLQINKIPDELLRSSFEAELIDGDCGLQVHLNNVDNVCECVSDVRSHNDAVTPLDRDIADANAKMRYRVRMDIARWKYQFELTLIDLQHLVSRRVNH
jgi:hypothetical protein